MATTSLQIYDCADYTLFRDTDTVTTAVTLRAVQKQPAAANYVAIINASSGAIATLNTAENLLQAGGPAWDNATPAQRSALMLGLTRDVRALIRLILGLMDKPS